MITIKASAGIAILYMGGHSICLTFLLMSAGLAAWYWIVFWAVLAFFTFYQTGRYIIKVGTIDTPNP